MLRVYLRDPQTLITVECPLTKDKNFDSPITTITWDLKEATGILAQVIGEKQGKPPIQVLMESAQQPWEIVAKWKVDNGDD